MPAAIEVNGQNIPVTGIGEGAFKGQKKLKTVKIGKNVKTIGKNAFSGCKKLSSVTFGASVTAIGDSAFDGCTALSGITVPAKVAKIGKKAFNGCKKLKNIVFKTAKLTSSSVGSGAFKGIPKNAVIKCPKKVLKSYQKFLVKKGVPKTATFKK